MVLGTFLNFNSDLVLPHSSHNMFSELQSGNEQRIFINFEVACNQERVGCRPCCGSVIPAFIPDSREN